LDDGQQIPVGALIARESMAAGAQVAAFSKLWAGQCVLVDHEPICISDNPALVAVLDDISAETSGRLGGLPDVMRVFSDRTVALRETRNVAIEDRLGPKQHALADLLRKNSVGRLYLAVVEWGIDD
jgi:hypothetical protein